jgi:hypothetical protein
LLSTIKFDRDRREVSMDAVRLFTILTWIALPTVMYGGASLLGLLLRGNVLTPFQVANFRAGHAHAGVLLIMALVYYAALDTTGLAESWRLIACLALVVGILAQSGGFFLHMGIGRPDRPSLGTRLTLGGALLLAAAVALLVYALIALPA